MLLDRLKSTGRVCALFLGVFVLSSAAQAGPEDGRIVNGSGSISQSGTHTDIHQNSDFLATHWGSFNIAAHESVQAHQPNSTSRLLIRVDGGAATNIAGNYTSNGITILENQNGVQFSRGAIVNVGGLLATSSRISGVAGANWQLNGTGGAVVNHGTITAGAGGAILAAVKVQNTGDITAKGGDVALGAGSSFTVDFAGSMVGFEVSQAASGASITNTGKIEAQGGVVALSAQEAQAVRTNVVSVGGVVKATRLERRGGVVYLSGGTQGIAEVSGDVQASKKVQATGEYVVVKEGALLKAPKILVGGDFQGKGDVPTARRTLVERGALLDAGAEGRVIVWSDETTWFNGNITAPDGFAEVSGKEVLASVNLAGIDVGELLLDPTSITIVASGGTTELANPPNGNIAANEQPSSDLTLTVTEINDYAGDLSLAATGAITVNVAILKPTGNLTLTAGGVLTISANITTSAGDLTLTGTDIIGMDEFELRFIATPGIALGGDVVLTGGAINLTGTIDTGMTTRNLTINASGILTLNSTIGLGPSTPDLGALTITALRVNIPSAIGLNATMLRIEFTDPNAVGFETGFMGAGAFRTDFPRVQFYIYAPQGCTEDECVLEPSSTGRALHLNPTLMARTSITIDARFTEQPDPDDPDINEVTFIELIFSGTGPISITAPTITITATAINIGNRALTINANGGSLTLNTVITATAGSTGAVMLSATDGALTLRGDINVAGSTGAVTLSATNGALTLEGDINAAGSTGAVTLSATNGALTLGGDINTTTGDIALTSTQGIILGGNNTLTGGAVSLTGVIMRDTALTVTATGAITLNSDIILTGASGNLTLNSASGIILGGNIELSGSGFVDLTGAIDESTSGNGGNDNLTITATGAITLNSDINLGMGALRLIAGMGSSTGDIGNGGTARQIMAGSLHLQTDTILLGTLFTTASRVGGAVEVSFGMASSPTFPANNWLFSLGQSDLTITATGNITFNNSTIDLGMGTLTLSGTSITLRGGPSALRGGAVSITGNLINRGNNTVVSAATGDITITGDITAAGNDGANQANGGDGGAVTLTANNGNITTGNIDTSGGQGGDNSSGNAGAGANGLPVRITAGGMVQFGDIDTRGGDGGDSSGGNGGDGGNGGQVVLSGTSGLVVGSIMSTGGAGGAGSTSRGGTGATITMTTTSGDVTLGGNVDAGGTSLTINVGARINVSTPGDDSTAITAGTLRINFADSDVQDPDAGFTIAGTSTLSRADFSGGADPEYDYTPPPPPTDCSGPELTCRLERDDENLTITSTTLTAPRGDIIIDIGTGTLDFIGTTEPIVIDAGGTVTITAGMFNVGNRDLTITSRGGRLRLNIDITTTGNLTLFAGTNVEPGIVLSRNTMLSGTNITITGVISVQRNLTVTASGVLTLNSNISILGRNTLSLTGMRGITLGRAITLVGSFITLNSVITGNNGLTISNLGFPRSTLTLNSDINLGTGDLTLNINDLGSIVLGSNNITLAGDAVSITGVIDESEDGDSLTITATDRLTLNSGINLGGGTLAIKAGERINIANANTVITARGGFTIEFTDAAVQEPPSTGFTMVAGVSTLDNLDDASTDPAYTYFGGVGCTIAACELGDGTTEDFLAEAVLSAAESITIDIGGGTLTFEGDEAIMITSQTVSITAGNINIGARALTITANNGALTIGGDINARGGDLILSGMTIVLGGDATTTISLTGRNVTLTGMLTANAPDLTIMAGSVIRLNDNIDTGAGDLTLMGANIALGSRVTSLRGDEVSLTGMTATRMSSVGLAVMADGALTLNNDIDIGMGALTLSGATITLGNNLNSLDGGAITLTGVITRAGTNSLAVTAGAVLRLNDNIDTGADNITLTLRGDSIVLDGSIMLTGGAVTLAGAIDESADTITDGKGGDDTLTINASGNLTLNSNINLGTGNLILTAGASSAIRRSTTETTLTASEVRLTQGALFAQPAPFLFAANTLTLRTTATDPQIVYGWMDDAGRALSLRAGGSILVNADISTGTSALTLHGTRIVLPESNNNPITLTGGAVTLTGVVDGDVVGSDNLDSAFTITATGDITINNNINLGAAALTLTATGTANIVNAAGTQILTASTVSLMQPGAFANNLFTIAASVGALTLEATAINTDQTVHAWMVAGMDRTLSLTTTGAITINSNIDTGMGALTLDGTSIFLRGGGGGGTRTLAGSAVMLTGNLDSRVSGEGASAKNIMITAGTGNITITGDIITSGNDGEDRSASGSKGGTGGNGGAVTLTAMSGNITVNGNIDLNGAGGGAAFISSNNEGGRGGDGGDVRVTAGDMIQIGNISVNGGRGGSSGGAGRAGNGGDGGMVNLEGSVVMVGLVNAKGGEGGSATSSDGRSGGNGTGGQITLTATGGNLTLNGAIDVGGGAITLIAERAGATIGNGGATTLPILTASTVSLDQVTAFDPTAPFTFNSATSLTLTTAADQTVYGWMTDGNRALSLTTGSEITVNEDIDTGTRALTLSAGTSIFLRGGGGGGARTLAGSAVTLTGTLDSRVSGDGASANNIMITADNGNITINGNIMASGNASDTAGVPGGAGGALTLTANSGNITIDGNINLNGGAAPAFQQSGVPSPVGGAGGTVTLMAGNIMIDDVNARGGKGGTSFGNTAVMSGNGGNGGVIMITASGTATIGGLTAGGGAAGDNTGNSTAGSVGTGGQAMITASGGNLTLGGNVNVDRGTITLEARGAGAAILNGGDLRELTASTVSLTQVVEFASTAPFTFGSSVDAVNFLITMGEQRIRNWMMADDRSLSVHAIGGPVSLLGNIEIGAGDLTLNSLNGILFGGDRTLSGGAITLTGAINHDTRNLIITATGQLTLNSNITVRILTLTAGTSGTGDIVDGTGTQALTADTVSLTQAGAFDADADVPFTITTSTLELETAAPQTVHDWMVVGGRNLSLTSTGGAIMIGRNITLVAGNLTLSGMALTSTGARILSGANISLTGPATSAGALNITASGTLTLNSNITTTGANNLSISGTSGITTASADVVAARITLTSGGNITTSGDITAADGNGALTLDATGTITLGGDITLGTGTATLNAGSATGLTVSVASLTITAAEIFISFSNTAVTVASDVPAIDTDGGTATITLAGDMTPTIRFGALGCTTDVNVACVIGGATNLVVEPNLVSEVSITIDATTVAGSSVRFDGTGTITLTSPLVTIIAETINLEGRNLVIVDTNGGTLALAGNVSGAAAITVGNLDGTTLGAIDIVGARTIRGATITLTATGIRTVASAGAVPITAADLTIIATGGLTIATGINIGTGTTLTLTAGPGDITGTGTPTLTAGTVSLTQDGAFGDTALFMFETGTSGTLELETGGAQMVESWMVDPSRALSLTSGGEIFIDGDINVGTNALTLVANGGLINLDRNAGAPTTLTGGAVLLTGIVDGTQGSNNFTIAASGILTLNSNITTAGDIMLTGTSIVVRGGGSGTSLSGRDVELTGAVSSGVSTASLTINASGDITINDNIVFDLSDSTLTLRAGTDGSGNITSSGTPTLTVRTVSLTQAGTFAADLFTLAAGVTSLTLNAGSAAQTVHAWMAGGTNRVLSLTTTGEISIGRDITTGTSNLTLVGGSLTLTAAATLSGADVALTGAATGTDSLTITASGTLTLNSNITLTGSGALTLTAGTDGTGDIADGTGTPTLTASTVSLDQASAFGGTALFTFAADTLNLTTAAPQTVHGWMFAVSGRSLSLTSTGGAIRTADNITIDIGTGDLTLDGMGGIILGGFNTILLARNVVLTGAISGTRLEPTLTITAMGDITINGNITFDGNQSTSLTLTADADETGTGNITIVGTSRLAAREITLTQAGAFASPPVAFTIATNNLNLVTGAAQTVHPWMVGSGRNLSLTSNGGSITVDTAITVNRNITLTATTININADIGTSADPIAGLLTLDGDTLAFSGARTLSGANISLTGAATNAANLTITTAGTLTIAASIAITGGDLMLTGTSGIVIGTATGAGALTLSGDAITLAGAVTTASTDGAANRTDLTITAQGALSVAGIDLSNNDDSAHGALVLIAGAGTQTGDITFVAGAGGILNAASVELRQDTDFDPAVDRPVDILIEGMEPGLTGNPDTVVISGDTQVLWAAILVTQGDLTITDGGANDPDGAPDNGIELDTARLAYTGTITLDAGAGDITFETSLGNITWEAQVITITAGSIELGDRNLTIITEGGTLTLNVADITSTGNLVFTGTTIRLGRAGFASDLGTTTLTGAAITLTAANGITVGRFTPRGGFAPALAPALVVDADGVLTIAADITSVANITLGSAATDSITITGVRTLSGSVIRFNSDVTANDSAVTANDGLTVNSTAGNLTLNGNIDIGMGALSLTSAAGIRAFGDATRTLDGGDITLTATNGVSAASGVRNLTVTAGGVLTIAANITMRDTLTLRGAGAIGNGGTVRVLTASTVSLRQVDVFATAMPFRFGAVSSLVFMTDAAQAVHDWMIALNSDLTITSAGNVFVRSAIGGGLAGRDLGTGDITLTSTTGFVRIFADILTTGNITLSGTGTTGINFNNGAAKTLSGAIVMLTGVVVSNRALTITASGILTLSNNITTTGTNALSLRGGGGITLGSALTTLSGGDIMLRGAATGTADLTITARGILTLNSNITLTGTGNLTLTGATIQIGRASSDGAGTQRTLSSGANITLTAVDGIQIGRFNGAGTFFTGGRAANLTVTAQDTLTIAADITVASTATAGGDITLTGTGGGIVIGTAAIGSSTLIWEGSDITLAGAVTTASTAGIDNFTSLTLSAGGNLVVGEIDLANNASGTADAWGALRLRAGDGSATTDIGTITVTGGSSTPINAGSILFEQDGELFAAEPATLSIDGVAVGMTSLRSMVLVLYRGEEVQASVDWGTVIDADAIDLGTGGDLEIALNNGVLLSLVSITINAGTGAVTFAGTDDITLAAPVITITAGSINTNNRNLTITTDGGTLTLNSNITLTGTGNLTLTSGTIQIVRGATARTLSSGANITLTAADGILLGRLTGSGFRVNGNAANFTVTAQDTLTIAADITVASTATAGGDIMLIDLTPDATPIAFTGGVRTITGGAITLTGAAMGSANLTITASGILRINNNIDTGAGALTLSGADAIVGGVNTPELTASTVRLTQASVFDATELFTFDAATGSLVLITTDATDATDAVVDQSVHNWMINDGINLTVMSPSRVIVEANIGDGNRTLGAGSLTLTSTGAGIRIEADITTTGAITLDGATGINTSGATRTLSGEGITLVGRVRSVGAAVIIDANGGILSLNGNVDTRDNATFGDLTLEGAMIQIGRAASTTVNTTRILLRGGAITLTSAMGIQIGRFSGSGAFSTNGGVANLTVTASGVLTIAGNITVDSAAASGGDILLTGGSIAFGDAARTITGRVITLTGAATGTADLTITASGTLTINNNIGIGAGALTLSGAGAIVNGGTATLTASTVSLEQDAVFTTTEPFAFGTTGSLALTTEAAQVVHNWMIADGRSLTVTSAGTVFVRSAIGSSGNRNLGAGDITLESTGGTVRIFVGITTGGAITLIGGTGGINFDSRGAKTLSGGTVTLSGNARSNRALTLTATSGLLTLNGDINTGTSALSLSGSGGITLGSALTLTGGAITLTGAAAGVANLTINASGILMLNDNIGIGAGALTLSGAGVIDNGGTDTTLTASTVRLTQVSAFGDPALFTFGGDTGSLTLSSTSGNQTVHPWMQTALTGGSLTITTPGNLIVGAAPLNFVGNNITLTSGGMVRIGANITTAGNIILTGTASSAIRFENGARVVTGGNITLNGFAGISTSPTLGGGSVTLTATATNGILTLNDDIDTGANNLSLTGATIQIGRRGADSADRVIELSGGAISLTSATNGIEIGRFNGRGAFSTNGIVANLTVTASGVLTIAGNITVASTAASGGGIDLTGGSIAFGAAARTITGGAIALRGAAEGTADLTLTARGTLRVNSSIALTGSTNPALTLMSTAGAVRILADLSTTGDMTLSGATGINLNSGRAKTLSGAAITLNGNARSNRAVTITASSTLTLNNNITVTGATRTLALSGAGAIVTTGRPRLAASTVRLTQADAFAAGENGIGLFRFRPGSLMLNTDAAQDVHNWMISPGRDVTITSDGQVRVGAAIGADVLGRDLGVRSLTLVSTGADIRIEADITTTGNITLSGTGSTGIDLSGAARTITGRDIMLTGVAMSDANVTITATGALTLNSNIALTGTGSTLALRGAGAIGNGGAAPGELPELTASTVSLRQVDVFGGAVLFTFGAAADTGSLEFTTTVNQDVHDWMINDGINLTVTSAGTVRVAAAIGPLEGVRNLGNGDLTLTSTGGGVRIVADISTGGDLTLNGATGINLRGGVAGARTLAGAAITLNGNTRGNQNLILDASGILGFNGDIIITGTNDLTLMGAMIQIGRRGTDSLIELRGGAISLTSAGGIQIGRLNGRGAFLTNGIVANLAVTASGVLTIAGNITVASTAASGGDIGLTGGSIAFGDAARTITGRAITLSGAATGTADLTITASGTLTINNDIGIGTAALTLRGAGAISNGGNIGADRLTLTAGTVNLRQDAAFVGARPFSFGTTTTDLLITATVNQDVLNWMIIEDTNLTVTSAGIVRVAAAIGGSGARNLGDGNLTLESTGGAVRILANISTGGDLTLNGATGINLRGGVVGVRTLSGAIITLTGAARSNRDLTFIASGTLTLNDNIDIGARALSLTGSPIADTSVDLTAGDYSFTPDRTCNTGTMPSCTTVTP